MDIKEYNVQQARQEYDMLFRREIARAENPLWLLDCLKILGHRSFSLCKMSDTNYQIRVSSECVVETFRHLDSCIEKKLDPYDRLSEFKNEWENAYMQCCGILALKRIQQEEEKKATKDRISIEEEVRSFYSRSWR